MAELILEVLTRGGAHVAYHKVDHLPVTIGRALDNDIILPDPAISQRHLTIEAGEAGDAGASGWVLIDNSTTNGTFLNRNHRITGPTEILSGAQILIGKTILRALSPTHSVPEALSIAPEQSTRERTLIPILSVLSILITGAAVTLSQFLNVSRETKLITLLAGALPLLFFPFFWAGIWSFAGFVIRRRGTFGTQLIIANSAFIVILLITVLYEYIDYFTCSVRTAGIFQYLSMALLSSLVLYFNLKTASGTFGLKRLLLSIVIGSGVVAAIAVTEHAESFEKSISPEYSQTLKPPYAKVAKSVSLEEFMKNNEKLFEKKNSAKK